MNTQVAFSLRFSLGADRVNILEWEHKINLNE